MNDDLISRKALFEHVEKSMNENPHSDSKVKQMHNHEHRHFLCMIMQAPTAFDKEKVMEKLKHCRDYYDINEQPKKPFDYWECADIRERKGKWMAYDDAIEIVEKGGIE